MALTSSQNVSTTATPVPSYPSFDVERVSQSQQFSSPGSKLTAVRVPVRSIHEFKPGDHGCVERLAGLYYHHFIVVDPTTVIEYGALTGRADESGIAEIRETPLAAYSGDILFKVTYPPGMEFPPEEVITRARQRLREQRYDLVTQNCEHFASWCKTGRSESLQVNELLGVLLSEVETEKMLREYVSGDDPDRFKKAAQLRAELAAMRASSEFKEIMRSPMSEQDKNIALLHLFASRGFGSLGSLISVFLMKWKVPKSISVTAATMLNALGGTVGHLVSDSLSHMLLQGRNTTEFPSVPTSVGQPSAPATYTVEELSSEPLSTAGYQQYPHRDTPASTPQPTPSAPMITPPSSPPHSRSDSQYVSQGRRGVIDRRPDPPHTASEDILD